MAQLRQAQVTAVIRAQGSPISQQLVETRIIAAPENAMALLPGDICRAGATTRLCGELKTGDRVLLEVGPLARKLGTGGLATVVGLLDRLPAEDIPAGHIVKARYTPLQIMVCAADEQGSPYHQQLQEADNLENMPVVVSDLHSALPANLVGIYLAHTKNDPAHKMSEIARHLAGDIAYVMNDGGALPLSWSQSLDFFTRSGFLSKTITVGQSFGGQFEAVNIYSGLLVSKLAAQSRIALVAQGPGNLGTDTKWGFSGTNVGEALNAVNILSGRAVACLRMSSSDSRERHRGVSHHSLTALTRVVSKRERVEVAAPDIEICAQHGWLNPADLASSLEAYKELAQSGINLRIFDPVPVMAALEQAEREIGFTFKTMGRSLVQDPLAFIAAAGAGKLAWQLQKQQR